MGSSSVDLFSQQSMQSGQRFTVALLCAGLLTPLIFIPFVIWAGLVTPGYSHISSTFSDAAAQGQPHPEIMGTGLLLLGISLAFFAVGCFLAFPRYNRLVFVPLLLTAFAIGGTGMFRDYNRAPGSPRNLEGLLHNGFAVMAIISATAAILISGLAARRQPGWSHLFLPALWFRDRRRVLRIPLRIGVRRARRTRRTRIRGRRSGLDGDRFPYRPRLDRSATLRAHLLVTDTRANPGLIHPRR